MAARGFFLAMSAIGLVLGVVIYAVVAFPWARRPRYRNFGAMPRTGIACGAGAAVFIIFIAWNTAFAEFYQIEIERGFIRLHYVVPQRTPEIPLTSISGMRRSMTLDKRQPWRIQLETSQGMYYSTNMNRRHLEDVWRTLADFVKPLE